MEAEKGINGKREQPGSYSENSSFRDPTSNNGSQRHENHWEQRRDHGKNRGRGRDQWNRDKSIHGKRKNSRDEESREIFNEEQPQLTPSPSASYRTYSCPTNERSYMENNHHALSVMSYNMMAAAAKNNSQWGVNAMDGVPMAQNYMLGTSAMPTAMEMVQATGSSINPFNFMQMPGEFGMIGTNNFGIVGQFGMVSGQENAMVPQVKEVINFSKGVLLPPNFTVPPPSTHEKPAGCRTVCVGGLPEKITEAIMKEIFEKCGVINSIQMSANYCQIRFQEAASVERALYYSGYKLKINNCDEPPFTGRLHVDYVNNDDDHFDYECYKRRINRVARHQELDNCKSATPPAIHYTEHEAAGIAEKLRNEETFLEAAYVLINWLDRGECTKRNAGTFYSMIQSTNSHVRRLINEKEKYEEELNDAKEKLKKKTEGMIFQFYEIEKVFKATCLQKVWDNLTKAQRKNIDLWKKQTEETKNALIEKVINEREDEEMDLSDDENNDSPTKSARGRYEEELAKLREENDSLRCQLKVAENEIVALQAETEEQLTIKKQKISSLCAAIQQSESRNKQDAPLQDFCSLKPEKTVFKDDENPVELKDFDENNLPGISVSSRSADVNIHGNEARLIGLVSTFLHIHPFGASIDYICSFLQQINPSILARDVENVMKKYQTVFREHSTGIGASLGKKWHFLGFESQNNL